MIINTSLYRGSLNRDPTVSLSLWTGRWSSGKLGRGKSEKLSLALAAMFQQCCLDHCQPARSYFWNAKDRHRINSLTGDKGFTFTGDQRLFAKSTIWLALRFTLFSDGVKHCSFPVNLPTREIDWQITILLTDDRQDNYKRAEWRPQ